MDRYHAADNHRRALRQNQIVNAVVEYRYFAPAKLARDEAHERMRTEAALLSLVNGVETSGRLPLTEVVRQRLGGILILIGTGLQGAHAASSVVPCAAGPRPTGK